MIKLVTKIIISPDEIINNHIKEIVYDCGMTASRDAYRYIISTDHILFTILSETASQELITEEKILWGFMSKEEPLCYEGGFLGLIEYIKIRNNSYVAFEDPKYSGAEYGYKYKIHAHTSDHDILYYTNTTDMSKMQDIYEKVFIGYLFGIVGINADNKNASVNNRISYCDYVKTKPIPEGLFMNAFDDEGILFLVTKKCYAEVFNNLIFYK